MKNYTVIILLLGLTVPAFPQLPEYNAQVFGEEYGFGDGIIFDHFIDREQFIWVTTPYSLQRFDGRNVRKYAFNETVTHAICSEDGRIWVLTGSGHTVWRNRQDWKGFEQIPFDTSSGVKLYGIFQMKGSPVNLLTTKGLYEWHDNQKRFQHLPFEIPAVGLRHHISRIDTCQGTLMYPVKGGVCAYNLATGMTRTVPTQGEFAHLMAVTPDLAVLTGYLDDSYWLDFKRGERRKIDAMRYGLSSKSHNINILSFMALGAQRFLVSSKFGLSEYDLDRDTFYQKRVFAAGKPIASESALYRMFQDKNGIIWANSATSLVAIRAAKNSIGLLRNYHFKPGEQWDERVFGMVEDDMKNIWFAGFFGLKKLNLHGRDIKVYPNEEGATDRLNHHIARALAWDGKNLLIGQTYRGVWIFDPRTERYRRPVYPDEKVKNRLETDYIDFIGSMRNGDQIVCGRFKTYCIKPPEYKVSELHFSGDKVNMNTVSQDTKGRVWLGSDGGIHVLDEQYRFLFDVQLMPRASVHCIFQKEEGTFLIGTSKGLLKLTLLPENHYSLESVPIANTRASVPAIFRDSLQRFWFGTQYGLFLANAQLTEFQKFDFADNIQSHVFNPGSIHRASNGMVFMGGQNGINYFRPELIAMTNQALDVSIQSININDGDTSWQNTAQTLELEYWQNTLTFEVVAPYYNNVAKVQYRYRLNSHDDNWVLLGSNNSFRLPKLPPGQYRLEVSAGINGKVWYELEKPLLFNISPPFWQRWPFRIGLLAAFGTLIFGLIRYFQKRERKRQREQLELEKLKNTNLLYQLETEQVVNYFSRSIGGKNTVEEVLWDVAQQCISRLGWEDCVIYLLDPKRKSLGAKGGLGTKILAGSKDY